MSSRWEKVKSVVGGALERDRTERDAYIARACADDVHLRREVDSLLSQATASLEDGARNAAIQTDEPVDRSAGRRVGAWLLEREVGRGGMGTVWLANRADGRFEQTVAVKLLKRGTDTEDVLRRFRGERQILALLEHPNIARLLDGGETDDGLPFLVMEYVAGMSLTDYVVAERPSIVAHLTLFEKICGAVEFAHQRLVVHRDLKPSNILVTPDGEPKLLDFGIAKLVDPADAGTVTLIEHRPLTPAYASPEQLRGAAATTVSDVYSLGVLLYETLGGRLPHCFRAPLPPPTELARIIAETPPRPSLVAEDADTRRRLRGDLDNVVLRALATDPTRRYPNARALADELRRHREGKPVRARPDTWSYRSGKFLFRHKLATSATALIILALLGGGATTWWQARRAERRFQDVRRLANAFLFETHDAIATLPGSTPARQLMVSRGLEFLAGLAREAEDDRALQLDLAAAYIKVGDVQGKPYTANLGDSEGAVRSYQRAIALASPAADAETGWSDTSARRLVCQARASLGEVLVRISRGKEAEEVQRLALAVSRPALAADPAHAEEWGALVVSGLLGLGNAFLAEANRPFPPTALRLACDCFREALPLCERLAAGKPAVSPESNRLARTCSFLAVTLAEIGRQTGDRSAFDEAFALHDRTVSLFEADFRREPGNTRFRRGLGDALVARASARVDGRAKLADAAADGRRAIALFADIAEADPSNMEAQQDLSTAHFETARACQALGETAAAAQEYRDCLAILAPLVKAHPENAETAFDFRRARQGLTETGDDTQP